MSTKKAIKSIGLRALRLLMGRRLLYRVGRAIWREARLDVPNSIDTNGELDLIKTALQLQTILKLESAVIIDCGANIGDYSLAVLRVAKNLDCTTPVIYALEPVHETFMTLKGRIGDSATVKCMEIGLSDGAQSFAQIHVIGSNFGINSLHRADNAIIQKAETIRLSSIDQLSASEGFKHVLLLKIDTEGHDCKVLQGAEALLKSRAIAIIQFEYNYRWIYARHFLRDTFELLEKFGYSIGKVTPWGAEFYSGWTPELDNFVEANFVACIPECKSLMKSVPSIFCSRKT